MPRRITALAIALILAVPAPALACMWDHDTLRQERARFPRALELITGKFLRHSKEAYEWRIRDRTARLAADPKKLALHDDLAVAYHKVGNTPKAIEVMTAAQQLSPDRYETLANLGTFHILAGDLERGLALVDRALAINPDAHFGRERYQKWLVEYAISRRTGGQLKLPLRDPDPDPAYDRDLIGFAAFLRDKLRGGAPLPSKSDRDRGREHDELARATKGVLGMMRFANHDNPLLLEALGDLLGTELYLEDAKQLAARAYLQASYVVTDPAAKAAYRDLAAHAVHAQVAGGIDPEPIDLEVLETEFESELAEGAAWYARLRDRELGWIAARANVDAEFDQLYTEEPVVAASLNATLQPASELELGLAAFAAVLTGLVVFAVFRRPRTKPLTGQERPVIS